MLFIYDSGMLDFKFLCSIIGLIQHTKNTKAFYADPVYKLLPSYHKEPLEINENGQIMNLFESIGYPNFGYVIHMFAIWTKCSYII